MQKVVIGIILAILLLIESTFIAYPFVFVLLFLLGMRYPSIWTLGIVFVTSFVLDTLRVIPLGTTSLFVFALFFFLFLYNRALHLGEIMLVLLAAFVATIIYSTIANYPFNMFLHILVFSLLFVVVYKVQQSREEKSSPFSRIVQQL